MLVSSQETGELEAVLADGGLLTDLRTAFAAVLAARTFMQQGSTTAVVVGTGVIATLVAKELAPFLGTDATLLVVSRTPEAAAAFVAARKTEGKYGTVEAVPIEEGIARGDVVVTATPSESPVVTSLRDPATRGQVVVALGSDSVGKRELGPDVVKTAALVVADSKSQCLAFGECASAVKDGVLEPSAITELGEALDDATLRAGPGRSVIVDLTGVAVQDVVIASMTLDALIK
mmetsp:Transcript_2307/g.4760  ORF Transcript_2307/g.4760 Transcript_2307/m.4760 type:complete len:233 (-) Transcript_2307:27-725(-)